MFTGSNLIFKDSRVDKLLLKHGYNNSVVFYSPIQIWLFLLVMLILQGAFFVFIWVFNTLLGRYLTSLYLLISYLLSAYLNNSFACTSSELIVVNPNFPFRKCRRYSLDEIEVIVIDKRKLWLLSVFGILGGGNYLELKVKGKKRRYFCVGLDTDACDENFTEKTIEELDQWLKRHGISTQYNLD